MRRVIIEAFQIANAGWKVTFLEWTRVGNACFDALSKQCC